MSNRFPNSCEDLLCRMLSFDTTNNGDRSTPERELAAYLESVAAEIDLTTTRLAVTDQRFNLLITCQIDQAAPWLFFESHMDTVSADGMSIDPFAEGIHDDRIHGRGACDTKGSGAAMLWALRQYTDSDPKPNNIAILYTVDEEVSGTGIRTFVGRDLARLDWRPTAAIVGEPTRLQLVVAHGGSVRWNIHTRGLAAHSSNPANGRSAISMMAKVIDMIESRYVPEVKATHPLVGTAQCSINQIHGGSQINVIPDRCTISIDRRVVPGEDVEQIQPDVEKLLDELRRTNPNLDVVQAAQRAGPVLDPATNRQLADIVRKVLARRNLCSDLRGESYGSHAGHLSRAGVPSVLLGPGDIAQAHTHNEWLVVEQLLDCATVYHDLMCQSISISGDQAPCCLAAPPKP